MSQHLRRSALAAAVLLGTTLNTSGAQAHTAAVVLDGVRDAGYHLLTQDPAGDLAPDFSSSLATSWADLTNLYVTTDTTSLWVYVDLPNYTTNSVGEFGLAIDTDGVAASGGSSGPEVNGVTFAYTSTRNNVDASPLITSNVLLPDVVIHGRLFSSANAGPVGWTELNHWNGSSWDDLGVNWGGITQTIIGTHIGFSYNHGIELSIPFNDLGASPTSTLNLEFYAIGLKEIGLYQTGALDTLPSDAQAPARRQGTTQRRFATLNPPSILPLVSFSSGSYAVAEASGSVPITITVAPTSTHSISVTLATANGSAGLADYVAVSQAVTITPGQSSRVIPLTVLADALVEPDETVLLSLSQAVNAQLGQPFTATLTIHDSPPLVAQPKLFLPLLRR